MDEPPKPKAKATARRRLSAALRENLKRRKAQARGRAADAAVERTRKPHDSAGIPDDN
jgi:hypothetical protein